MSLLVCRRLGCELQQYRGKRCSAISSSLLRGCTTALERIVWMHRRYGAGFEQDEVQHWQYLRAHKMYPFFKAQLIGSIFVLFHLYVCAEEASSAPLLVTVYVSPSNGSYDASCGASTNNTCKVVILLVCCRCLALPSR